MLKTYSNAIRFPNTQYKLRYAYQFLTDKPQRTMWIHLHRTVHPANGEETYELAYNTFPAFLTTLDRHFGDPDEKHTASLALDRLRQSNLEFSAYYADFQELMDILETTDDTSRCHVLKRGLNHKMLSALTIFPTLKDESFNGYVKCLNELDCRLCTWNTHSRRRPHQPHPIHPPTTDTAARPSAVQTPIHSKKPLTIGSCMLSDKAVKERELEGDHLVVTCQ